MRAAVRLWVVGWLSTREALAWVQERAPRNGSVRYRLASTVCDLPLREAHHTLFSWRPMGCDAIRASVRSAFEDWARNAALTVVENGAQDGTPDVEVSGAWMPGVTRIAHVRHGVPLRLEIGTNRCWYLERELCYILWVVPGLLWPTVAIVWIVAIGGAIVVRCMHRPSAWTHGVGCAVSTVIAGVPLLVALLWSCGLCHDLRRTLLHEVGHVLGLGHSDDASGPAHRHGCGAAAVFRSALGADTASLMRQHIARAPRACLSADDADAVRTLYGGNCSASVACTDEGSHGLASVGLLAAYAVGLACAAEVLWWCACTPAASPPDKTAVMSGAVKAPHSGRRAAPRWSHGAFRAASEEHVGGTRDRIDESSQHNEIAPDPRALEGLQEMEHVDVPHSSDGQCAEEGHSC